MIDFYGRIVAKCAILKALICPEGRLLRTGGVVFCHFLGLFEAVFGCIRGCFAARKRSILVVTTV